MADEQPTTNAPATTTTPAQSATPTPAASAPAAGGEGQAANAQATAEAAQQALDNAQQKKGESDQEYETRIAKLTREARTARAEVERFKGVAQTATAEVAALKAEIEKQRGKKGITRAQYLHLTNTINEIVEAGNDPAKIAALFDEDAAPDLPPAVQARLDKLEKALQQQQERESQHEEQKKYASEINYVQGVMKELVESGECPLFDAFPGHAALIRNQWHAQLRATGQQPDEYEIAHAVHKAVADDIFAALQSERARSFLLKAKPELKALFGGQEVRPEPSPTRESQGNGRGNGPAANAQPLAERKAETPPSTKKKSRFQLEQEERQRVHDAMAAHARAAKEAG